MRYLFFYDDEAEKYVIVDTRGGTITARCQEQGTAERITELLNTDDINRGDDLKREQLQAERNR